MFITDQGEPAAMRLNPAITRLETSGVRKMFQMASADAINLGLGEPDFDPPPHVIAALHQAAVDGHNKYDQTLGIRPLREVIATLLAPKRNGDLTMDNVAITNGATHALFLAISTILSPGDEVLYPSPGFVLYHPDIAVNRGVPVPYAIRAENGFDPDLEELQAKITPQTRAMIVNSPSNPTGGIISEGVVKGMIDLARDHGFTIITDEVYDLMTYDSPFTSFMGPDFDDVIYINSFSKTYAMTGWRLGYLAAQEPFIVEMSKLEYYNIACPPTMTQWAGLAALTGPTDHQEAMIKEFDTRRHLVTELLNGVPGLTCALPGGAFYVFPAYDHDITSEDLAIRLVKAGLICAPGTAFGPEGEGHLRFSYVNSQENLRKGISILREVLADIPRRS